ncbi:ABC transporter ATP-binding protein [Azotosporobacter soli]|uniref:ABC transporter ATP-binding protein n=1 Tax=Azotosporobacter soli TaxID=3055040 RepID=UPI0031FE6D0F
MNLIVDYICELYRFSRGKFLAALSLMILLGLLEGVGVVLIIPLLGVAGIIPGLGGQVGLMGDLNRFCLQLGIGISLPLILVVYLLLNLSQSLLQRWQTLLNVDIQQSFCQFLAVRLFRAIAYAKWQLLMTKAKSELMHIIFSELMQIGTAALSMLGLIALVMVTAVQIILALWIAPLLTVAVLVAAAFLFWGMRPFLGESRKRGHVIMEGNRELFNDLTEHLNGIKEIKSYSIEAAQVDNFSRLYGILKGNVIRFQRLQTRTDMLYKMGATVFISLFLYIAIDVFKLRPEEFVLITVISSRLWPRFSSMQTSLQNINMLLPSFKSVRELEQQCLVNSENLPNGVDVKRLKLQRGIELRDVSFAYAGKVNRPAVTGICAMLPSGTTTALVGVSGAGKSTLVDLLIGLLIPKHGVVLIDGKPLQENLRAWRNSIGYVSQDPFLINASIRENLKWASPAASDGEVWEALRLAAADGFVSALPEGLSTVVGDRGVRLSGGERQRIVLARALLRKPAILILDEATSALDSENEKRIQQAIEGLQGKMTIVVIAHRISTIRNADQIFVVEQGRIVEQGNYQSLTKDGSSRFYSLASLYNASSDVG